LKACGFERNEIETGLAEEWDGRNAAVAVLVVDPTNATTVNASNVIAAKEQIEDSKIDQELTISEQRPAPATSRLCEHCLRSLYLRNSRAPCSA
jgi:hypothetical protein